ncbi:MAG: HAMP domain-containing histidine kinase [Eubacterium sp.]|nr:HAMP domain-containing histidine kinase [Eubacterium sp.]
MEALKASMAAKITAAILVIVSLVLCIAGFAGMMMMDAVGGYRMKKEDMLHKGYEEMCTRYSVAAMAKYMGEHDMQELEQSNFRYGILKAEDLQAVDYLNPDNYLTGNLETNLDTKDLYVNEYDINEDTQFRVGGGSILDAYYTMHETSYYEEIYTVQGWVYDMETEAFYVRADDKLFQMEDGEIIGENSGAHPLYEANRMIQEQIQNNETVYTWSDSVEFVFFFERDSDVDLANIAIVNGKSSLEKYGDIQTDQPDYFDGERFYISRMKPTEHYIVVSYVNDPLLGEQSFEKGDMFVQTKLLVDFAYRVRYAGIVILILSLVVLIAAFSFLMAAAGHRKGRKEICASFLDYVPFDLYFAGMVLAETLIVYLVFLSMEAFGSWSGNSLSGVVSAGVVTICAGILSVLLGLAFCMSFAVRVKLGKWWRHTVVYWILKKCMRLLAGILRYCGFVCASLIKSVTLLWKAWFVLGALAFLEFIALEVSWADGDLIFFWLLEKLVVYPVVILLLLQMHRLQKGAQQIADGRLDYQVDTRHMFWEIKKHGEYLNDIGHGMNNAVNERMKSERFKTELITNVSHDIKTPLTSIINYVDLLQKEEINNPVVQEYLEVLHRQSARLKKLIEDLMEASKASTGSLSIVMEQCDAGVMLIQTIGEFEEKLMAEQIELQIKKPEADILIEADHRHLWRVFDNLMNNICKYAQPSTRAYVNLDQNGQQAVITFRNISKYQLNISSEELMERFVRGDSSRNTEGSGLGISIAKSLTELMNGTFELIVDGDLFKVVLTFPLYGKSAVYIKQQPSASGFSTDDFDQNEHVKKSNMLDGLASGLQNAGSYAAGVGQGVADKTGRMVRRAGRFAYHVRQAAKQAKEEEALELAAEKIEKAQQEKEHTGN